EKEELRLAEERAKAARLDDRMARLAAVGVTDAAPSKVEALSDEEFAERLEATRIAFEKREAARIEAEAEAARKAAEEEAQRQAEAKRLADERAELERIRAEQEAERKKLDEERDALRREQEAKD